MRISLSQKFSGLLLLFVAITIGVLYMLVQAKNEPIDFAIQEKRGNEFQRPLENLFSKVAKHRVVAQRALYGEKSALNELPSITEEVDAWITKCAQVETSLSAELQFTDAGLATRKRDHYRMSSVSREWQELKSKLTSLKPEESNEKHQHLIADLRTMITHLGDTSNLVLDPDLDSYYLMDITLIALPQTQDRIQSAIIDLEPIVRSGKVTLEERIRASVYASMMTEADLGRIEGDFSTVGHEDQNFYGRLAILESQGTPAHQKFVSSYKGFIELVQQVAAGKLGPVEEFIKTSDSALDSSFEYSQSGIDVLDGFLQTRADEISHQKQMSALFSVLFLAGSLFVAWLFLRYLVRNLRTIVSVLSSSSKKVFGASKQSASSATQLSEAATEQAASLQQTMASAEEISAMVGQNADSANKTQGAVEANRKVSEEGSRNVDEMLGAIREIRETNNEILSQMEASNKEFSDIVKIISEIGEKTNVINEIVFQTKLLSFNASVEAARAGEHGKGFAVVAEEVGNLAQMSGNAAKEITDMLSDSIKRVNTIVENTKTRVDRLIEAGKDKILMGQKTAEKCKDALIRITENAKTIAGMMNEISHASKEQAQGIQEINKAISQLDRVTQQNSAVAQQSSVQAEALNNDANGLSTAVHQLISFVDGEGKDVQIDQSKIAEVVSMESARPQKTPQSKIGKKAVGYSGETPSGDDPAFEEF